MRRFLCWLLTGHERRWVHERWRYTRGGRRHVIRRRALCFCELQRARA